MPRRVTPPARGLSDIAASGGELVADPFLDIGAPIHDSPPDPETSRTHAEMSPVAQGRDWSADDIGCLCDREQVVIGCGHGVSQTGAIDCFRQDGRGLGALICPHEVIEPADSFYMGPGHVPATVSDATQLMRIVSRGSSQCDRLGRDRRYSSGRCGRCAVAAEQAAGRRSRCG